MPGKATTLTCPGMVGQGWWWTEQHLRQVVMVWRMVAAGMVGVVAVEGVVVVWVVGVVMELELVVVRRMSM